MSDPISQFEFPKIYSFPPFYTQQPNTTVLNQQLDSWVSIILHYCEYYRITSLSIEGIPKHSQLEVPLSSLSSIFINKTINRQVNSDFQKLIVKHLIHNKKAEFINPKKPELGVYIYWRSLVDWGDLLYQYVEDTGQKGTVLTIYELTKSEETTVPQDLHNLDETFLVKIIKDYLIKQGKAQLLIDENNEIGGVKIV
ncbi:ESCRT-II complex subunit VPS25 [Candida albicans P78042]|uniref:Vacuolar protein-sorting-associated protein 25 n=1 Tax=Candida albicans (strain WO-1) TaxID=294748 RepID=C4YRW9_CANAW|nr:conserved hypothetical protein [Candida albicans WO-1]KGU27013.1 ESCRT-II complex subunit VPS25 [Candida albicans P57055]KHC73067.1 ESCRT-II complex subunit VPS25 [Candida albicans P78042]